MIRVMRLETPADAPAISALITAAFAGVVHASGKEAALIADLRAAGALALSLVGQGADGAILAHAAFSRVTVDGQDLGWFGLGPVAVAPARQQQGLGSALIRDGLSRLADLGAKGCVVLGDPAFYHRFDFAPQPGLVLPGVPPTHFMALALSGLMPKGIVAYHPAFDGV